MTHHRAELGYILNQTDKAVIAEVIEVGQPLTSNYVYSINFTLKPLKNILGIYSKETINCVYSHGMPHKRGETNISPLINGSGIEANLKKGDTAIFLFDKHGKLLRAEPSEIEKPLKEALEKIKKGVSKNINKNDNREFITAKILSFFDTGKRRLYWQVTFITNEGKKYKVIMNEEHPFIKNSKFSGMRPIDLNHKGDFSEFPEYRLTLEKIDDYFYKLIDWTENK